MTQECTSSQGAKDSHGSKERRRLHASATRPPVYLMSFIMNLDIVLALLRAASSTQCLTAAVSQGDRCTVLEQAHLCREVGQHVKVPVCTLAKTRGGMEMTRYSCSIGIFRWEGETNTCLGPAWSAHAPHQSGDTGSP